MSEQQIVKKKVAELKKDKFQFMPPYGEEEMARLIANVGLHGVKEPIHVDEEDAILDGHNRTTAAEQAGLSEVPCIVVTGLTDTLFIYVSGYEKVADDLYRVYVDGPVPKPQLNRRVGERTHLFHLFAGADATRIEAWLASHRAFQCLRVPTYTREKGVRAVLAADRWRGGDGSALSDLGRDHIIRDENHRRRLQHEVELLIGMVLEKPVRPGELEQLHDLQDVVNAGPVKVELSTAAEVIETFFGSG